MHSITTANHRWSSTDYTAYEFDGQWADVDHPLFYYDPGFKDFCNQKLSELEQLREGWDCEGAPRINREIVNAVRQFVASLPQHIAPRPMVVPLSSGSVQLEWHHGPLILELEFESPETVHYLKWDSSKGIEEEEIVPVLHREALVGAMRWFVEGMLDA